MFERFTRDARSVVEAAAREASALGHSWIGTEHLLLALFAEDSVARRVLLAAEVRKDDLLGEYRGLAGCDASSDRRPDPDALAAVGIDLDEVRRRAEEAFGTGALEETSAWRGGGAPRWTPKAKKALQLAVRDAMALGHRHIGPEHVLLGLARVHDGLAARLLGRRGLTSAVLRAAVEQAHRRPA